jgi:O-6-methylguanine DNA methyltransferase
MIREWIPNRELNTTVEILGDPRGNVEAIEFKGGIRPWSGEYRLGASIEIEEYLAGERTSFTTGCVEGRIDRITGPFRRSAMRKAMEIPYGQTVAYSELAESMGSRAWRAVGSAMARNPVAIIVPCHRVVAKHGIGGFGGDVGLKRRLLVLEGADLP